MFSIIGLGLLITVVFVWIGFELIDYWGWVNRIGKTLICFAGLGLALIEIGMILWIVKILS